MEVELKVREDSDIFCHSVLFELCPLTSPSDVAGVSLDFGRWYPGYANLSIWQSTDRPLDPYYDVHFSIPITAKTLPVLAQTFRGIADKLENAQLWNLNDPKACTS